MFYKEKVKKEKVVFGRPETNIQALARLPQNNHPEKRIRLDIAELAHLRVNLINTNDQIVVKERPLLENRIATLSIESFKLMEKVSFRRGDKLLTAWKSIPGNLSSWGEIFFPEGAEDDCIWWQICELYPKFVLPNNWKFISIETHPRFGFKDYRSDDESRFDIGLVTNEELQVLIEYLSLGKF